MRKAWKRTAQTLLAASSLGLITTLPAIGFPIGKQQPAATSQEDNPEFLKECEGNKAAMEIHLTFLADTTISNTDIHAYYRKGKLVIKGNANQQSIAKKAKILAEKITTHPVQDEIRVWPFPTYVTQKASQENLQKAAEKCVHMELGALYPKLKAMAQSDGTVLVKGPIISLEDKLEVSKKVRKIPGCTRVDNQLEPQPMVRGRQTVILLTKDGQKFIPNTPKTVAKGMTTAPESWPVFQSVKSQENPTVASTKSQKNPTIVSTQDITRPQPPIPVIEKGQPKDLPLSVNGSTKTPETPKILESQNATKAVEPWKKPEGKPLTLPEMPKLTAPTRLAETQSPVQKPLKLEPVAPNNLPKVQAVPTSESKEKAPVFQPIPSAKLDKVETAKIPEKQDTKIETAKTGLPPVEATIPRVNPIDARKSIPAHDPKGSIHVRTDALGFPQMVKDVPLAAARKKTTGTIPEQYQSVSDKNPSYERPYLAVKPATIPNKPLAVPSQEAIAKNAPTKTQTPGTTMVATVKPSEPKVAASKNTPAIAAKPASLQPQKAPVAEAPKVPANTVSNNKESKPKIGTGTVKFNEELPVGKGTVTFEDEPARSVNATLHESYKKTVMTLCKDDVKEVQVMDQPDGKVTISLKMINGKDISQVAKKLLSLPEFSQSKVDLEFHH